MATCTLRRSKEAFLDDLVRKLSIEELAYQLTLFSGNWLVGPRSDHSDYDKIMHLAPEASLGIISDWYCTAPAQYNALQSMTLDKSRHKIPLLATGECLHQLRSNKHTVFPQILALSSSFDKNLVERVARALGTEARSTGIAACYAPVLDIAKDPRYGRTQETFGEDFVVVSQLGVAYCSGLSKNGAWADQDAVIPVIKHFAGHGSPSSGLHSNWFVARGRRELLSETLVPFKAALDLGNAKGIMMTYTAIDDVPAHVEPFLYKQLKKWRFDGFIVSDWKGLEETVTGHHLFKSPSQAILEWLELGGNVFYYDFDPDTIIKTIIDLIAKGTLKLDTLQRRVRSLLGVKYDAGLFKDPFVSEKLDSTRLLTSHAILASEAAKKSIILLKNHNSILPLNTSKEGLQKIALIGPFVDSFNFGSYSGTWGANPGDRATTLREGILGCINQSSIQLLTAWGANSWEYNSQYPIPGYLLSTSTKSGGLLATYYRDTLFQDEAFQLHEIPNRDWGLYPPLGLDSNSFSAVWEGDLEVPVTVDVNGWIGVAVSGVTKVRLYIDGELITGSGVEESPTILPELPSYKFTSEHRNTPPPAAAKWLFRPGTKHHVRIEYQTWVREANQKAAGVYSRIQLWWNLVDREDSITQAKKVALDADVILLAVGAASNSDGENGDRATLGLSSSQKTLVDEILGLGKPVVIILQGGRPFAIPSVYERSTALLSTGFLGQASGQAIAQVLFGKHNPGGRLTMSIPRDVGSLPAFYNDRTTKDDAHIPYYLDIGSPSLYHFGFGLSYTTFSQSFQSAKSNSISEEGLFSHGDVLTFTVSVKNTGDIAGSHVHQIYLLRRQESSAVMANKQLVAFDTVDVDAGVSKQVSLELEVDRYLPVFDRDYKRVLDAGDYEFVLADHGGLDAETHGSFTLTVRNSHIYEDCEIF